MKVFVPISSLTVLAALLTPAAVDAKKDSPHRIFRTTRSKAAKAEAAPNGSPPNDDHDEPHLALEPTVESKAGKASVVDAKTFKEILPKAGKEAKSKAIKSKCLKEDAEPDFTDLDLVLDFASLSMSTSMSYAGKSGKSAKASPAKCSKYDFGEDESPTEVSFRCVGDFDKPGSSFPLCPGLSAGMYCDGQGDCESHWCSCDEARAFCETKLNPCFNAPGSTEQFNDRAVDHDLESTEDDWFVFDDDWWYQGDDWYSDDDWWYYGDDDLDDFFSYADDWDATEIISWFLQMLSECAGVPLDYDTCLVENAISILASGPPDDLSVRKLRGIGARKMQNAYSHSPVDDFIMSECEIPAEEDITWVVDGALGMCEDNQIDVKEEDYLDTIDRFTRIFTNVTCVCAMY